MRWRHFHPLPKKRADRGAAGLAATTPRLPPIFLHQADPEFGPPLVDIVTGKSSRALLALELAVGKPIVVQEELAKMMRLPTACAAGLETQDFSIHKPALPAGIPAIHLNRDAGLQPDMHTEERVENTKRLHR